MNIVIRLFRITAIILVFIPAVSSCDYKKDTVTATVVMPLYKSCNPGVEKYIDYVHKTYRKTKYRYKLSQKEFTYPSVINSITGLLEMKAYWSGKTESGLTPLEALEVMANGVKAYCYPESQLSYSIDDVSISKLVNVINKKKEEGVNDVYITIKPSVVTVNFNNGDYELPGL